MATTFTIPLTTLPLGVSHFGPASVADADTQAALTIDRTVAGGLNSVPAAQVALAVDQSSDGGATWVQLVQAPLAGGSFTHHGVTQTQNVVTCHFLPGTGRQARATVTVSGATVAVAGSLVTS